MSKVWTTNSSTNVESMVNSVNAACDSGFLPNTVHILENPGVEPQVSQAVELITTIVEAYGDEEPEIQVNSIDEETDFDGIRDHHQGVIEAAVDRGDEVAVDITPGRKFMGAIAFATGMRYGADHVFYFYLASNRHRGRLYPEIPQTATNLYDFTEDQ